MNTTAVAKDRQGTVVNGVNVGDVKDLIAAIEENPQLGSSHFRLTNKWINGGHNRSRIVDFDSGGQEHKHGRVFKLDADEPPVLAGTDKGANPVEYLLHALSSCLETTLVYHAAVRGIEIRGMETRVEGDLDLRGFLGISDGVRRGFENIRVEIKVDTPEKDLNRLKALSKLSPVFDTTRNGTNVDVSVSRL
ncbi:MAG: OsmC family protein [Woeseiaceae bacterium]|nr:OsmC family protein [Woeseiaceae bacterium]